MSKAKKTAATDTKAAVDTKTTSVARRTWDGLRDVGFSLMAGAANDRNLGTQTLAAAILAYIAEFQPAFEVGDSRNHGDLEMLGSFWNVTVMGATGDATMLKAFRSAVMGGILPPKPEPDSKNGTTIKGPDYAARIKVWNDKRATLSKPFQLAAAMAFRQYDAGDFLVGHGFNIERRYLVPTGFALDNNVMRPQSPDDVICLEYKSAIGRDKPRDDQTTHIRDKSANIGVVTHTVEGFINAQRPAKEAVRKGIDLASAVEYIAKIKETPRLEGAVLSQAQTAMAVLSRIIEASNKPAVADVERVETDGHGNRKVA